MATVTWTGAAGDGLFGSAKNWAPAVPGAADMAVVGIKAAITSNKQQAVNILMMDAAASLKIDGASTFSIANTGQPGTLVRFNGVNFLTFIPPGTKVFSNEGAVNVEDGSTLQLSGNEYASGTISLLATKTPTKLVLTGATALYPGSTFNPATQELSGLTPGQLVLSSNGLAPGKGAVITAAAAQTLMVLPNFTIKGAGLIGGNVTLTNFGLIDASGGQLWIKTGNTVTNGYQAEFFGTAKKPALGLMQATKGGTLVIFDQVQNYRAAQDINNKKVPIARGVIAADGGDVYLVGGAVIDGGILRSSTTNLIYALTATLNGATQALTIEKGSVIRVQHEAPMDVTAPGNGSLTLTGVINNAGKIELLAGSDKPNLLLISGKAKLAKAGIVTLGAKSAIQGAMPAAGGPADQLVNAGNTIKGSGAIGGGQAFTLINEPGGVITASGGTLSIKTGEVVKNGGTMDAVGGDAVLKIADNVTNTLPAALNTKSLGTINAGSKDAGGTVELDGSTITGGNVHVYKDGVLTGKGTIDAPVMNSGKVDAKGDLKLEKKELKDDLGINTIENDSTLELDSTAVTATTSFAQSSELVLGDPLGLSTTLTNFTASDLIDLLIVPDPPVQGGTIALDYSGGANGVLDVLVGGQTLVAALDFAFAAGTTPEFISRADPNGSTDILLGGVVPCFAAGTRLLGAAGEVAVEDVRPGDRLVTLEQGRRALQPVIWVGRRRIDLAGHPDRQLAAPIRIRKHAFAPGLPRRDLRVSPDHGLYVDGALIPAKSLVNDMTIVQERDAGDVTYLHVELARHGILLAEGLAAESYLDTGNRAMFGAAAPPHPAFGVVPERSGGGAQPCARLLLDPAEVLPPWSRLARRAAALGYAPPARATTSDPRLRLLAGGRSIAPLAVQGQRYIFPVPAGGGRQVRLRSRAAIPADGAAYRNDWRRLGVGVARIAWHADDALVEQPLDAAALREGWHAPERQSGRLWRWTDGDAALPLPTGRQAALLELRLHAVADYAEEGAVIP